MKKVTWFLNLLLLGVLKLKIKEYLADKADLADKISIISQICEKKSSKSLIKAEWFIIFHYFSFLKLKTIFMLLDLLFPNRCLHCNSIISKDELVCEICVPQIKFSHYNFYEENPLKNRCKLLFPVENAFALMEFEQEGLSRKIIHQLKYHSQEKVGKILADWTTERLQFSEEKPDILVTVPLHPKKLKKRGYNQLHLYANTLSKHWNIPHHQKFLKRNSYQKAQARKDKLHRLETKYDFSVTENLHGKHILLIDDVFTTGNTMNNIAWEILKNPSNKISILVMAIDV